MADENEKKPEKKGMLIIRQRTGEKPNETTFEIREGWTTEGVTHGAYYIDDVRVDAEVFRLAIQLDQMGSLDGIIRNGITIWKGEI